MVAINGGCSGISFILMVVVIVAVKLVVVVIIVDGDVVSYDVVMCIA